MQIGILSITSSLISNVLLSNRDGVVSQFPDVFQGVGKLKGMKLKLHIDWTVNTVVKPVRRLPFGYRDKVKAKVQELVNNDVVEPVSGVGSTWVSPLACILQGSGEIRQTVDMRCVNKAVVREHHLIHTTKEMLVGLQGAKVFSKLDLKQSFHQIELDEETCDVTKFVTLFGLYRYKRLTMGLNSAPEQFQYTVKTKLLRLHGIQNLADDIILHRRNSEEHDKRLL